MSPNGGRLPHDEYEYGEKLGDAWHRGYVKGVTSMLCHVGPAALRGLDAGLLFGVRDQAAIKSAIREELRKRGESL